MEKVAAKAMSTLLLLSSLVSLVSCGAATQVVVSPPEFRSRLDHAKSPPPITTQVPTTKQSAIAEEFTQEPTHQKIGGRFYYPNFQNRPALNLNGDSTKEAGELVLTLPEKNQVGTAWYQNQLNLDDGFVTTFQVLISRDEAESASGVAFVLQNEGPYATGRGGSGIGYHDLAGGVAIEIDTYPSQEEFDPAAPHVSIHDGAPLSSREMEGDQQSIAALPLDLSTERIISVSVSYENNQIQASVAVQGSETVTVRKKVNLSGSYWVGFTGATGDHFARFSVVRWAFSSKSPFASCEPNFTGEHCEVTNAAAVQECPRLNACNTCVEDVYNCVWCSGTTASQDKCVPGTLHATQQCTSIALDPLTCANTLSHVWQYALLASFILTVGFGLVFFRSLPLVQSFRAISILVAMIGGAIVGMLLSFVTSAALVEITESKLFAFTFGSFLVFQSVVLAKHIIVEELPYRGWDRHSLILVAATLWIAITGTGCFYVEKSMVHWLPESWKVFLYMTLGGSLNFSMVLSAFDLSSAIQFRQIAQRCQRFHARCRSDEEHHEFLELEYQKVRDWKARMNGKPQNSKHVSIARSFPRIIILCFASLLSGIYYGYIFGTLRVGEESSYRVALAFQQESLYTLPVGALIGAISSVVLLSIQLPHTTDDEIDRLIREASDGL